MSDVNSCVSTLLPQESVSQAYTLNCPPFGVVKFWELQGSPQESYSGEKTVVRRTFLVPWRARFAWAQAMTGYPKLQGAHIQRVLPQGYEHLPAPSDDPTITLWLFPTQVDSMEGYKFLGKETEGSFELIRYAFARVTLTYESVTYKVVADGETLGSGGYPDESLLKRYVTKIVQPAVEYMTLPYGQYKYVPEEGNPPTGTPVLGTNGTMQAYSDITYTWHQVPRLPPGSGYAGYITAVFTHPGTVNESVFDGFPPETLLLLSVESRPYRTIGGVYVFDYIYKMRYRNNKQHPPNAGSTDKGHNHILWQRNDNPATYGYYKLTADGTGSTRSPLGKQDFSKLFKPE
jgi:hypothetical protein